MYASHGLDELSVRVGSQALVADEAEPDLTNYLAAGVLFYRTTYYNIRILYRFTRDSFF